MIGPAGRISDAFRIGPRAAEVIAVALVAALTLVAIVATGFNVLPLAIILTLALFATVASVRWPLVMLALFAAFIPIEEVVLFDGVGTISRIAAIAFAVTYGIPRLGHLTLGAMPARDGCTSRGPPSAWAGRSASTRRLRKFPPSSSCS